ncbi:MAG: hypothetical protein IJ711_12550 [Lachnospiraceae bacterium]|nr:hypothetical protein [Lachnospiraceae bacterium]
MRYYIVDQVKQAMKGKGIYIYAFSILVLSVMANISMLAFRMIYGINDGSYGYNLLLFAEWCYVIPYYSTILIAQTVFGDECPNPRIRNKVTIGLKRIHLYFGQFLAELVVAAGLFVVSCVCFIGVTYLFMFADHTIELWVIGDFLQKALFAVPLWITGIAVSHMLFYVCKKKRYAYGLFFCFVIALPRLIMLFAAKPFELRFLGWIRDTVLLTPRFNELPYFYTVNVVQILLASLIYTAAACAVGVVVYNRKEY